MRIARRKLFYRIVATLVIAGWSSTCVVPAQEPHRYARLNERGVEYAGQLISEGAFNADKRTEWRQHHPSKAEENKFIRDHSFEEYAQWYLAVDETHPANTKAHYKFPYGDFKAVHRCALLAVKSRAHQYGYSDIEKEAGHLLELLEARQLSLSKPRQ